MDGFWRSHARRLCGRIDQHDKLFNGAPIQWIVALSHRPGPVGEDNMLHGMLIGRPVKYWPHYTAIILETKTGQRWAVDSWIGDNGENPSITKIEDWYLKSASSLS